MPDKKNYFLYMNNTDKILQKKLENMNTIDENEYTKELSNQKLVEDITNNVIKALSKNIESIVTEQINNKLGSDSVMNDDYDTHYQYLDDFTKKFISKLQSAGMQIEYRFNNNSNDFDAYWIDNSGNKHLLDLGRIKKSTDDKTTVSIDPNLIKNYNNTRKSFYNYINLFPGAGGIVNGLKNPYLAMDEYETDFSNHKVKSNIGYFLDKTNMSRSMLAEKASVSRGTVLANLEEANGLSLLNAYKISKVMGIPMEELFVFTDKDDEETDIIE